MYKRKSRKNFNIILYIIIILQSVNTYKIEEFVYNLRRLHENDKKIWSSLLRKLDKEAIYEYVLIVGDIQQHSAFLLNIIEVELAKSILLNQNDLIHYKLDNYSSNFICIVYMPCDLFERDHNHVEAYVKRLGEKLDLQRFKRLLMVQKQCGLKEKEMNANIALLLELFKIHKFLNVVVILSDFAVTRRYYAFKAYPTFELVLRTFNETSAALMFPLKMNNVYGAIVRTIPDQVLPRSVVYKDSMGRVQVTGYIAQFLRMYAKYINSTLKYNEDLAPGNVLFYRDFIKWTEMDLLDIPCSITPMLAGNTTKLMSYMYEVLNWCLMMPVEEPQTYKDFLHEYFNLSFILIVFVMNGIFTSLLFCSQLLMKSRKKRVKFYWSIADIIANAQVILGHLGSSFILQTHPSLSLRIIYVSLFVSGLLYTTTFSVKLNAFLTRPPALEISTLDDMLKYKKVILAASNEYKTLLKLSGETFLPYLSLFKIVESYKEFSDIRSSFNTCCSYPVTSSVWHVYETQQKLFTKPRFRRTQLCFVSLDIMGFILPSNSLHKHKLDTLITRVRDMGFMQYWLENSFYDLVKIGKMSLTDISTKLPQNSYILIGDFYFILSVMLKALAFSSAIFLIETVWHNRRRIFKCL